MAFDYGFGPGPVIDPETGKLVTSAVGQVYAAAEGGDALLVRQGAAETTNIQTGSDGMVQQFFADYAKVFVEFPGVTRFMLLSGDDLIAQAQAAAESAAAASNTMAEALTRTFQAVGLGILRGPALNLYATKSAAEADLLANSAQVGDLVLVEDPTA